MQLNPDGSVELQGAENVMMANVIILAKTNLLPRP